MNNIVFAGGVVPQDMRKNRRLEIIVPDEGEIIIVPPACSYGGSTDGIHICIEQPLINLKQTVSVPDVENGGIRHAARQAVNFFNGNCGKKATVLSALGNLLTAYAAISTDGDKSFSPTVGIVVEMIEKNVSDKGFCLETEIKKLPLNYDYIRKLFKKETGATPREYLLKQRMEIAANLLTGGAANKYSEYTVSQIAEVCGFSEPLYFSRVFKKYYGVAPSGYKNRI